jgi:LPXTG-site transpeptidase (sortase) family protein
VVSSLRIDAPIVTIAMSRDRVLTPPADPRDVGWWDASAKPGASAGQTVIAGHTVHTGGGQFDHLGRMRKGAEIQIVRKKRTEYYVATKVFTLSKQQVSDRAQELFGQGRHENRLVLITCGDWTGHEYLTNVFVYAKPVRTAPTVPESAA